MSLRARIILLFAATLVLTLAIASYLGERVAVRALESTLRDRSTDLAKAIAEELQLSPKTDPEVASDALESELTRRRGIRVAELAIRHGLEVKVARVAVGAEGPETTIETVPSRAFP